MTFNLLKSLSWGVETHLDIHVGAVSSLTGKLLDTRDIQTNQNE